MRHLLSTVTLSSLAGLVGLAGCCSCRDNPENIRANEQIELRGSETTASVSAREIEWNGWRAFELDNGTVRAIVVPDLARVMHYGFSDAGERGNVLWTNPDVAGQAPNGEWTNYGGDKVWPWPQPDPNGWPTHFGGDWPPPSPFAGVAWAGRLDGNAVVLEGPAADVYDVRPTRTIRLDPEGSGLTVTSTFTPTDPNDTGVPAGVWHVTQIPRDQATIVAFPAKAPANAKWMVPPDPNRLADVANELDGGAIALAPIGPSAKVGLDVPRLAAGITGRGPEAVLVQRIVSAKGDAYREANDRAQVWMLGTDGGDANPWAELEFTSPLGQAPSLAVRWELLRADGIDVTNAAAVAELAGP